MRRFDPNAYGSPVPKLPSSEPDQSTEALCGTVLVAGDTGLAHCARVEGTSNTVMSKVQDDHDSSTALAELQVVVERQNNEKSSRQTLADSKFGPKKRAPSQISTEVSTRPQGRRDLNITHLTGLLNNPRDLDDESTTPCHTTRAKLSLYLNPGERQADHAAVALSNDLEPDEIRVMTMTQSNSCTSDRGQTTFYPSSQHERPVDQDLLDQARKSMLKGISLRNKAKDKGMTTSLRDLDLARKSLPVASPTGQNNILGPMPGSRKQDHLVPSSLTPSSVLVPKKLANGPAINQSKFKPPDNMGRTHGSSNFAKDDLRPIECDGISNVTDSPIPSNASDGSSDSVRALHAGKTSKRQLHPLMGWDGGMQPPPANWHLRSQSEMDPLVLHDEMNRWTAGLVRDIADPQDGLFQVIPRDTLRNLTNHADGISMVTRDTTIGKENAGRYGYGGRDTQDMIREYANAVRQRDFDDWGKLDLSKPENFGIRLETTEDLVRNWVRHKEEHAQTVDAKLDDEEKAAEALFAPQKAVPHPHAPKLNIYLRAACRTDIPQVTQIYNYYVENSPRPSEAVIVADEDMMERFDEVRSDRLPFIVAIERSLHAAVPCDNLADVEAKRNGSHPSKNDDLTHGPMKAVEKIVGWACAQSFTAPDYVERISAELEVYVDVSYRQLGIGGCLMDKLLEACDRGYMKRGGYSFYCPPELRHHYNGGGGCDLHKLIFILRKWKHPKTSSSQRAKHKYPRLSSNLQSEDQENDYEFWVKSWVEKWGFEVEGVLKGAGAKTGRFVDIVHFGRETSWQPAEGHIPDSLPRTY